MKISDKSVNNLLANKVFGGNPMIEKKEEKILCNHCLRTASNGIRCMGICVADNDYWIHKIYSTEIIEIYICQQFSNYIYCSSY